jgi:type I restriction enzyme M protein
LLSEAEHAKNNLPDIATRWNVRDSLERERPRTAQSFCIPKADIASAGYDLSINRYRDAQHAAVVHANPTDIIEELKQLEAEISQGLARLEELLA